MDEDRDVTSLLLRWNAGDAQALDELTPVLYDDLRRLARDVLSREESGHTLSPAVLIHEMYLRLVDERRVEWENKAHFFSAAARIMRRVLVDYAGVEAAAGRGGAVSIAIENDAASIGRLARDIPALDSALTRLAVFDDRQSRIVEMKLFGGMTNQEVAFAVGVSDATVERDWKLALAWLSDATGGS